MTAALKGLSGIYFHIPFCRKRCLYCDFFSTELSDPEIKKRYGNSLLAELKRRFHELDGTETISVYFGGGSPSSMPSAFFSSFSRTAGSLGLDLSKLEVTVEVNPADIDREWISNLRSCGVNRLSVGIQAFDDTVLAEMGRRTTEADILRGLPVFAGYFDNISFDFIYGIGKNRNIYNEFSRLFDICGPKHVSAYQYTRPGRKSAPELLDEDETAAQEDEIREFLQSRGFYRYEISNFAQKGFESRHNLLYWSYGSWLGIGAGAASFIAKTGLHSRYADDVKAFIEGSGLSSYRPTGTELAEEFLMMGLRKKDGININDFNKLFGEEQPSVFSSETFEELTASGFLKKTDDGERISCTEKGSRYLNHVLLELFKELE